MTSFSFVLAFDSKLGKKHYEAMIINVLMAFALCLLLTPQFRFYPSPSPNQDYSYQ